MKTLGFDMEFNTNISGVFLMVWLVGMVGVVISALMLVQEFGFECYYLFTLSIVVSAWSTAVVHCEYY